MTGAPSPDPGPTSSWSTPGCEFTRVPQTMQMGGSRLPVTPPELDAAMARIDGGGRADFADSYAGLEVDQQEVRAIVYRVPSAAFDDFVRQNAQDTCVTVREAKHSVSELTTWQNRIVGDLASWSAQGIQINTVGARHDGAGVEIGAQDPRKAKHQLLSRYGQSAPLIFVDQGPVQPLTTLSAG